MEDEEKERTERERKAIVLGRDHNILPLANVPMLALFLIVCIVMCSSEICLADILRMWLFGTGNAINGD